MSGIVKPQFGCQVDWSHPLAQGLPGGWLMNEGSGGSVYDLSGQGTHGIMTNMDPATDWVTGPDGWAVDFDGSNDHVEFPQNILPSAWTTAVIWLKFTNTIQTGIILGHAGEAAYYDSYGKSLRYDNGILSAQAEFNNSNPLTSYTWGDTTTWHQVVGVFETAGVLYLDGVSVSTGNLSIGTALDPYASTYRFRLGSNYDISRCFAGQIAHAHIYNRALSAEEVASLSAQPYQFLTRPRRYWWLAQPVSGNRRFNPGLWTPGTNPGVM
jgi:hypothetical protein